MEIEGAVAGRKPMRPTLSAAAVFGMKDWEQLSRRLCLETRTGWINHAPWLLFLLTGERRPRTPTDSFSGRNWMHGKNRELSRVTVRVRDTTPAGPRATFAHESCVHVISTPMRFGRKFPHWYWKFESCYYSLESKWA